MNLIQTIEAEQVARLVANRPVPDFEAGDTLRVSVRVVEGERTRTQAFEGVCIARSNKGLSSNFTVRKISYGEGVERVFPLYAPSIAEITVVRRGKVRRAKLYYLRDRSGKAARIAERPRDLTAVVDNKAAPGCRRGRDQRRVILRPRERATPALLSSCAGIDPRIYPSRRLDGVQAPKRVGPRIKSAADDRGRDL